MDAFLYLCRCFICSQGNILSRRNPFVQKKVSCDANYIPVRHQKYLPKGHNKTWLTRETLRLTNKCKQLRALLIVATSWSFDMMKKERKCRVAYTVTKGIPPKALPEKKKLPQVATQISVVDSPMRKPAANFSFKMMSSLRGRKKLSTAILNRVTNLVDGMRTLSCSSCFST